MLAAEPSLATLYSTKSGSKRIFAMADVNAPPGAHDIYEEEELHAALTKLVAANTHVKRWLFKVGVMLRLPLRGCCAGIDCASCFVSALCRLMTSSEDVATHTLTLAASRLCRRCGDSGSR